MISRWCLFLFCIFLLIDSVFLLLRISQNVARTIFSVLFLLNMFVFVFLLRRIHFLLQKLFKSFQFNISYYYKLHYTFFPPSFPSSTVLSPLLIWFVTKKKANKNRKLYFTGVWEETNSTIYFQLIKLNKHLRPFLPSFLFSVWNKRLIKQGDDTKVM